MNLLRSDFLSHVVLLAVFRLEHLEQCGGRVWRERMQPDMTSIERLQDGVKEMLCPGNV